MSPFYQHMTLVLVAESKHQCWTFTSLLFLVKLEKVRLTYLSFSVREGQ